MTKIFALSIGLLMTVLVSAETADDVNCAGCVNAKDVAAGAIAAKHLSTGSVRTNKIRDEAVTGAKLADGAVDARHLSEDLTVGAAVSEPRTRLVDALGTLVGYVASMELAATDSTASDAAMVWVEIGGEAVLLKVRDNRLSGFDGDSISFASNDCSGAPYATPGSDTALTDYGSLRITSDNGVWRALPGDATKRLIGSRSRTADGGCSAVPRYELNRMMEKIGQLPEFVPPYGIVFE